MTGCAEKRIQENDSEAEVPIPKSFPSTVTPISAPYLVLRQSNPF